MTVALARDLRDHELAILRVLADGEEHARGEILDASRRACSPDFALAMFQQAIRSPKADSRRYGHKSFEGMTTEERMVEIVRQQSKGAKLVSQKALSHMVDGHFIEPVQIGMRGTQRQRLTFRILDRGRRALVDGTDGDDPKERGQRSAQTRRERYGPEGFAASARQSAQTRRDRGEDLSEIARERVARLKAEGHDFSASARKSWETRRARLENKTAEERRDAAMRGHETRRERERQRIRDILRAGPRPATELFRDVREVLDDESNGA